MDESSVITAAGILKRIPHRFPFLFVDRVVRYEQGVSATGVKQVTLGDPIFLGHFPGNPVFPGVLILEALGQLAAILFAEESQEGAPSSQGKFLGRIDKARFMRPVVPGDTLELEVKVMKVFGGVVRVDGVARVGGEPVASAELTFTTGN